MIMNVFLFYFSREENQSKSHTQTRASFATATSSHTFYAMLSAYDAHTHKWPEWSDKQNDKNVYIRMRTNVCELIVLRELYESQCSFIWMELHECRLSAASEFVCLCNVWIWLYHSVCVCAKTVRDDAEGRQERRGRRTREPDDYNLSWIWMRPP